MKGQALHKIDNKVVIKDSHKVVCPVVRGCNCPCCKACCEVWSDKYCKLSDKYQGLVACIKAQEQEHKKCKSVIKELKAKSNGIKVVNASEPREPKRRGRPSGGPATITKRPSHIDRTEVIDPVQCPHCQGHELSEKVTSNYDRVVEIVSVVRENVL